MPDLDGYPGNVIKAHGRDHTRLLFLRFKREKNIDSLKGSGPMAVKAFLRSISSRFTYYAEQFSQREKKDIRPYDIFMSCGISRKGFNHFVSEKSRVPKDPIAEKFFQVPMLDKKIANDFWVYPESEARKGIEENFRIDDGRAIDALIILACDNPKDLDDRLNVIRSSPLFEECVADFFIEYGEKHPNKEGPLGFRDNITNEDNLDRIYELTRVADVDALSGGDLPLGTFMAYQKISVNHTAFQKTVNTLKSKIDLPASNPNGYTKEQYAEAYLIGRFKDGTPLLMADSAAEDKFDSKDFNFNILDASGVVTDYQIEKCPFFSHIRSANPRSWNASVKDQHVPIIRRGVNYNYGTADNSETRTGLHFISYQNSVNELVQIMKRMSGNEGCADAAFYRVGGGKDVGRFPKEWGKTEEVEIPLNGKEITQLRGGEIFFMPAKHYLDNLIGISAGLPEEDFLI